MYRNKEIKIRLTEKELAQLDRNVARTVYSREGYIRMILRGYDPQEPPPQQFWKLLRELYDITARLRVIADCLPYDELRDLTDRYVTTCTSLQQLFSPAKSTEREPAIQ